MKYNVMLYPEKSYSGEGNIVAKCYIDGDENYPIYIVRSYSNYYKATVYICGIKDIDITYDCIELKRIHKKLLRKLKERSINQTQFDKIILYTVCNMIKNKICI